MSGQLAVKPGGQHVEECTVFNSDIRGFTRMAEQQRPEELVEMLNEYFERMVDTIFQFEGTLDKFMGDGIMALWGAPVAHPDDAVRSVACALRWARCSASSTARGSSGAELARRRHRHPHRPARRRLHRQLEGAQLHGHRRRREHVRAALLDGAGRTDRDQREHARAARRSASRSRSCRPPR